VYDAYLDRGYSPDNASNMLAFTKAYNATIETDDVVDKAKKAVEDEIITVDHLKAYLKAFGYFDDKVEYWADMAEYEKTLKTFKTATTDLFERYRMGEISLEEVRRLLGMHDLPASYIEKVIDDEQYHKAEKLKMPTRTELERWVKLDIIDEAIFAEKMHDIGYVQKDIEKYLTEITFEQEHVVIKYLPIKTYVRWYVSEILQEADFRRIATEMRITEDDINRLLMEADETKRM